VSQTTSAGEPFARRFERELYRRTGGRFWGLGIRQDEREVVVSCSVPSFHVRRLVVIAAVTALSAGAARDVVLDIRVGPCAPLAQGSGGDGARAGTRRRANVRPGSPDP
jgi:hypothetical protein